MIQPGTEPPGPLANTEDKINRISITVNIIGNVIIITTIIIIRIKSKSKVGDRS